MFKPALICAALGWLELCAILTTAAAPLPTGDKPPAVRREFRGLWVATVKNIDWPSRKGLSTQQQQEEMLSLLDHAAALHLNAIIFQVRPSCDAFYESSIEPWSEYLSGKAGQAPAPFYDPLAFAITEAHRRGLELHAWFNPYRVCLSNPGLKAMPPVSLRHPELVRSYGKALWLDPGEEGTRHYSSDVVMDVVRRYDIDGVHFDDYFYPYPEKNEQNREVEFPDNVSWERYQARGGKLSRADWRRQNVDEFVHSIYLAIKKEKPWVKFGVSPFGIWRPTNPPSITGFDAYNELFADSRKWLAEGWVDYLSPQLYWPIDQKAQSFPVLLRWWAEQNTRHRNLFPGMQVTGWKGIRDDAGEAVREIELTRADPRASGVLLWHAAALLRDQAGATDALRQAYSEPALTPAFPWLSAERPERPYFRVKQGRDELRLDWKPTSGSAWQWLLQKRTGGRWASEILPGKTTSLMLKATAVTKLPGVLALSAVDRYGNLSPAALFHTPGPGADTSKFSR